MRAATYRIARQRSHIHLCAQSQLRSTTWRAWSGGRDGDVSVGLWFLCARKYVAENIKKATIVKTNFPSEWRQGVWLGNSTKSSEFITDTEEEGVRALAINKLNEDGRWEERTYQENEWHARSSHIPAKRGSIRVSFDPCANRTSAANALTKELNINQKLFEIYGHTEECEGCRFKRTGFSEAQNLSRVWRARFPKAMEGDDQSGEKIRRESARQVQARVEEKRPRP